MEKKGFLYNKMVKLAEKHNNTNDYTLLHYSMAATAVLIIILAAALGGYSDFMVLYGDVFNNTMNNTKAMLIALPSSIVIQLLIVGVGLVMFKMWLNKRHPFYLKQRINYLIQEHGETPAVRAEISLMKEHAYMFSIYFVLFAVGLGATTTLSFRTDQRAVAEAHDVRGNLEEGRDSALLSLNAWYQSEKEQAYKNYQSDSAAAAKEHDQMILASSALFRGSKESYEKRYESGLVSKKKYINSVSYLDTKIKQKEAPYRKNKAQALLPILGSYKNRKTKIDSTYEADKKIALANFSEKESDIETQTAQAGKSYMGMNLVYNYTAAILTFLLAMFIRGTNKQECIREQDYSFVYAYAVQDLAFESTQTFTPPLTQKGAVNHSLHNLTQDKGLHYTQPENLDTQDLHTQGSPKKSNVSTQPVVYHEGAAYTLSKVNSRVKQYQQRLAKAIRENKIGVAENNKEKLQYWLSKQAELEAYGH